MTSDSLPELVAAIAASRTFTGDAATLPLDQIRRHLLAPLAFAAGVEAFRSDAIASSLRAELRAALLDEVITAFTAAGIAVVLLKGAAYAGSIYREPGHRPMSDLDLLVRPDRVDDAHRELRRLGYWHAGSPQQRSPRHHAIALKRRDASVDLHRHILQAGRSDIPIDDLWQRARASHVAGALRLAPVDELVVHLAHMARHELIVPAVNYVDAVRLAAALAAGQREQVAARAREWHLLRSYAATQICLARLLENAEDGPSWLPTRAQILAQDAGSRMTQLTRKLRLIEGPRQILGVLWTTASGRFGKHRPARDTVR